jgi:hypothetical protein
MITAHVALGAVLFYQGKPEPALVYFRRGLEMFDPNMQFPDWPGSHPGVQCQFWPRHRQLGSCRLTESAIG